MGRWATLPTSSLILPETPTSRTPTVPLFFEWHRTARLPSPPAPVFLHLLATAPRLCSRPSKLHATSRWIVREISTSQLSVRPRRFCRLRLGHRLLLMLRAQGSRQSLAQFVDTMFFRR